MNAHHHSRHHIRHAIPGDPGGLASPAELAEAAAEAVRFLNHATIRGGYVWPSDVAAVLAELLLLTERLPQALEQARRWLDTQSAAGRVGHDNDPDQAGLAVVQVSLAVRDAQAPLIQLVGFLQTARNAAGHLTGLPAHHDAEPPDAETAHGEPADGEPFGGGVR